MAINGRGRPTKSQKAETEKVSKWLECIAVYEREFDAWERRVESILKRYRDDSRKDVANPQAKFNILWSNVQTLVPATFARLPQPDVSRRFRDNDPTGRVASLILERALSFEVQHYPDYRATMQSSVMDRFLGGRGTSWARYEPHIRAAETGEPPEGVGVTEDVSGGEAITGDPAEVLDYECAPTDYVHWKDFGHTKARTWEEVTAVWRAVYLTRAACVERFGEKLGNEIPLDSTPEKKPGAYQASGGEDKNRAKIIEIWNKQDMTALWISQSMNRVLDEQPDPLEVEGFFPCPEPLYATLTNDSLIPVPDFVLYQDQANTLDILCDRIDGLCKMLQIKGVHDGSVPELKCLFTEGENGSLVAVKNWAAFVEKNGLKGAIDVYDITPIFNALREAYSAMEQQKQQVYEITGISDIVRGQTQASETLGAQEIKKSFVGLRLGAYKEEVALYATDILRLKAQVICTKFDPQTIMKIAAVEQLSPEDQALVPAALALLKDEPLRNFRIDIAADTLVQMDEDAEKQARMEFLSATGAFLKQALPVVQHDPNTAPLIVTLLKFGVTGFKVGKTIEGTLDHAIDQLAAAAKQPKPPVQDPAVLQVQAQQQADQMRLQNEQQNNAAKLQFEHQKSQMEAQLDQQRQQHEEAIARMKMELEKWRIEYEGRIKLEIAEISAKGSLQSAQISAAAAGADVSLDGDTQGKVKQGPMAQAATKLDGTAQELKAAQDQIMQAHQQILDSHQQLLDQQNQPQERHITMPSGRKYIRRDVNGATQIIAVQ